MSEGELVAAIGNRIGSSYTAGGLIHLLLVVAAIVVASQYFGGRRSI